MHLFLLVAVSGLACRDELQKIIHKDVASRVASFMSQGTGLDSLSSLDECRATEKKTYIYILWKKGRVPFASYGFCMPGTCDRAEIESVINISTYLNTTQILETTMIFKVIDLENPAEPTIYSVFFLISFYILLVLTCLATTSSILLKFYHHKTLNSIKELMAHFDIVKNFKKFLEVGNSFGNLGFFDGIRSFCAIFIVFFHSYMHTTAKPLSNRSEYNQLFDSLVFPIVSYLNYSVDIFFFIAGFLMSMLTIKEIQVKGNRFSWTKCIVRRLVRILPAYLFLIGIDQVFVSGSPVSLGNIISFVGALGKRKTWWKNLLFIQNHFLEKTSPHMIWTWSIAADLQFYLISLFFIYVYSKNKSAAFKGIFVAISLSSSYTAYIVKNYNISLNLFDSLANVYNMHYVYLPCWTRIPAFLVGVVFGMLYRQDEEKIEKPKNSIVSQLSYYLNQCAHDSAIRTKNCFCFFFINIGLVLVSHLVRSLKNDQFTIFLSVIWFSSFRIVFILSFAGLIVPMMYGYYKRCSDLLNLAIFKFFSKVSYSFYLIHMIVFHLMIIRINTHISFNLWDWGLECINLVVLSSIAALFVNIFIEMPFLSIEKEYLGR